MTINELNILKKEANDKIVTYQSLLSKISSINLNLDNCRNDLLISGEFLSDGLVIGNAPADDGKINNIADLVGKGINKLDNVSVLTNKKIKELQDLIISYDKEMDRIKRAEERRKKLKAQGDNNYV